jgi:nucleotide-binding universal stress UspA family protein
MGGERRRSLDREGCRRRFILVVQMTAPFLEGLTMTKLSKVTNRPQPGAKDDLRFRHILVPTDLTERTDKASQLAGRLASRDTTRVTLLHVIETIEGLPFEDLKPFYERMERKARTAMTALAKRSTEGAAKAARVVAYGPRAEEIVRFAEASGVDLIVLASHRVNPSMVNRDWGTISYKVGILAQCPVLLVK